MAFTKVTDNLLSSGVGTGAGNILELDSSGKLPAVDGSLLTGVAPTKATIDALGIAASSITGALPAISGASLTNLPAGGVDGIVSTANATAITIDSNENVGIGTSTPTSNLMVSESNAISSTGYAASQLLTIHQQDNTANRVAALSFTFGSDDRGPAIYAQNTSATGGVGDLLFAPSYNTESVRMLSTGGITFNGDTASANALDDYEEGNWTPAVTSTGGSLVVAVGRYTKIGRVVQIFCLLQSSTSYTYSNSTDIWTITGVPFAEAGQGYTGQPGSFYGKLNWNNTGSASTTNSIVTPTVSSTSIHLNVCNSSDVDGGNARIKCANNSGFIVQVNITYYTNA